MKKYILLLFIIHSALFIHAQKKVYVRMIDTSGWGNNFVDTAGLNADLLTIRGELADTSAAVRSALVDTASAIRGALPALEESQAIIDTASAIRGALPALEESQAIIDTASAIRSTIAALPTTNLYTADGTISDAVRNVTLGSNDINFDANTLFIDGSADQVGIGTTTPEEKLHIEGGQIISNNLEKIKIGFYDNTVVGKYVTQYTRSSQNPQYAFYTADSDNTDYNSFAFYGTGASDQNANWERILFQYVPSAGGGPLYRIQSEAKGTGTVRPLRIETGSNTNQIYLDTNGSVGIGSSAPSVKLDANGQIRARTWTGSNSTTVCRDANGVLVPCTSDARLKRNISPIDSSQALDKVIDLVPVTYRWKSENIRDDIDTVAIQSAKVMIDSLKMIEASDTTGEIRQQIKDQREILRQARKDIKDRRDAVTRYNYGFIAQQVRGVDEILSGTTDDGYLTVHNDQITSLLVGAIKAQEAKIKSQEMIIADLIARVTALEDK